MKARFAGLVAWLVLLLPSAVAQAPALPSLCNTMTFEGSNFIACTVDLDRQEIRLFLRDSGGKPYGSLEAFVAHGPAVVIAMNAGMYRPDSLPQGLYIESRQAISPLDTRTGDTNFYLKPNGVFAIATDGRAAVVETDAFEATPDVAYATQSGPMLVIGDELHPAFQANGPSRYIRNGVGVRADGKVVFAISLAEVSFGHFARLFRDALDCPDALYLDGFVSGLANNTGMLAGGGHAAGPIVAVLNR